MIPDGTYTAVVDRIEDELAVLEVEVGDAVDELVVEATALPAAAGRADAVLTVDIEDGDLVAATHDSAETAGRRERARERFDRLSSRPPSTDDGEDETNGE